MAESVQFRLSVEQLAEVAVALERRIGEGLLTDGGQIACIPTFVQRQRRVEFGEAVVLDLGGTNLRAARIGFPEYGAPAILAGPVEVLLPIERGVPFSRERFLDLQADALRQVMAPGSERVPLGYCFSYPAQAQLDGDATLMRWTKGIDIPGVVGSPVGKILLARAAERGPVPQRVVVVNDTVAALYASLALGPADGNIGLIVGTGTNMAAFFPSSSLPKLSVDLRARFPSLPINLESGNFDPPHLNRFDALLDAASENPGYQRFEKSVSGAYLGRLFALAMPGADFPAAAGAQGLVELLANPSATPDQKALAKNILDRSADLVAASLVGLCRTLNHKATAQSIRLLAEGSLFWKAPGYSQRVEDTLERLARFMALPTRCVIGALPNANLFGTALAALCHDG